MSEAAAVVASAFDRIAPSYDETFGQNPIGLYFRHVVQEEARRRFPPGARILDLGCGTGEDALFLAGLGLDVLAVDASRAMIARANAKTLFPGKHGGRVRFEARAAEDLGSIGGRFHGVFSDFGALNCVDLRQVGTALEALLEPGAPLVLSVIGPRPLPGLLREALTGQPARASEARVGGTPVPFRALTFRALREGLGPGFAWRSCTALGVVVPGPDHEAWARARPMTFGLLAAAERLVRTWPVFRGLGDHLVVVGARR